MADITSPPLLRLEGISKRYGATLALNNVRFDLFAGEVHALMGENGAGKSTLMKILSGNEQRDSGAIYINGRRLIFARQEMRANMASPSSIRS